MRRSRRKAEVSPDVHVHRDMTNKTDLVPAVNDFVGEQENRTEVV